MRDITHKPMTLRKAMAIGVVFCSPDTIRLIQQNDLPKGNVFDMARAAALLGAKHTPMLLPHCHPVSIDHMHVEFGYLDATLHKDLFEEAVLSRSGIVLRAEASSIGRTGIEMEVLTGLSIAALEIYDMLKPVDKGLEIGQIRLLEKKGGKTDRERYFATPPTCAVLVCSDSTAAGTREDKSGRVIKEMLEQSRVPVKYFAVVPDDPDQIRRQLREWISDDIAFIFTTGGTGLGPRDHTVDAVKAILERDADGIAEAMRAHGQMRTPLAMMSRGVAGSVGQTLIVTLPGSSDGARESLEAILPAVFHARKMMKGGGH